MAMLRHAALAGALGLSVLAFAGCSQQNSGANDQAAAQNDTVYGRVGQDKVDQLVQAWYKDAADTDAARLTKPYSEQDMANLLAYKLGSPHPFLGKDVRTAYSGMNVSDDEWKAFMKALGNAAEQTGLSPLDREQILVTIEPMKQDVVGQ